MSKIIATEWITLDGVVQGPIDVDEDRSGGFDRGGWHREYWDGPAMDRVLETVQDADAYLLGRGTYVQFAAHWPNASPEEQPLAEPINTRPKYVASTTLSEPLAWAGSTLLGGDVVEAVRALKADDHGTLLVIGSPGLTQTLLGARLIDELRLMIDPIVLGAGKRLFADASVLQHLRLVDSQATSTGAILATYATS